MPAAPKLSIVIPSYRAGAALIACLASLREQCRDTAEIVVVDSGDDDTADRVAAEFPDVLLVRCRERHYPGAARNQGCDRARAPVVAFTDADCIVPRDWVERVLAAHAASERPVIGGTIAPQAPRHRLDWAAYFCSFHHWLPGSPPAETSDIPTCCLSVKRWALQRHGPFVADGYSSDTEFNWRIVAAGYPLVLDPSLQVEHADHPSWTAFAHRLLQRGGEFARVRGEAHGWGRARHSLQAVLSPAVPLVLFGRLALRVFFGGRHYKLELARAAPVVFLGYCLWALGELATHAGLSRAANGSGE